MHEGYSSTRESAQPFPYLIVRTHLSHYSLPHMLPDLWTALCKIPHEGPKLRQHAEGANPRLADITVGFSCDPRTPCV